MTDMTSGRTINSRSVQREDAISIQHGILERLGPLMAGCAANLIDLILMQTSTLFSATNDRASVHEFVVSMSATLNHTRIETMVRLGPFILLSFRSISHFIVKFI